MTRILMALMLTLSIMHTMAQKTIGKDALKEGDLIFCVTLPDSNVSNFSNAITSVTSGIGGASIDHVMIVHLYRSYRGAIEALPRIGVREIALDSIISNAEKDSTTLLLVGRVKNKKAARKAYSIASKYLGRDYDELFMPDDKEIYCSELVQLSYLTKKGKPLFQSIPMTFKDKSGNTLPYWKQYYETRGKEIPEGVPGTNPAEMSRSKKVKIIGELTF